MKEQTSACRHQTPQKHPDTSEESQAMESVDNLCSQYEEKVRPCIDLIDSLRALGVEQDLALPAIAVIGDQSSGKSSVLEALSGVALPRGSGIVTRCPLVLKLKQLKQGEKWSGKVIYKDTEIEISHPSLVEREINKAQNLIAGEGLKISSDLISLEVSSPHVPDLTLIDLPGITRVAVGDQPADIEHKIKRLITEYIQKQETINLVVVPSNVDIATTEALKMAQEVDPQGDRTIAMVKNAFTKVSSNNFGDFLNLHSTAKSKIEDIRFSQEKEAEKLIRLHFQMEHIVYCQDQAYKKALKEIREKEAEKEKSTFGVFQQNSPRKELTTTEMTQHLNAYYQECGRNIGRQIPLIIQYSILQTFGQEMEKAMLQLLQDTSKCNWFLTEQSDSREKKKFLKRRLLRLDEAQRKLAKFSN
uniref:MX dynamin like GTPase 1 n=1 Tax=Rattus norvegicus TaxID=10116 RepID=A0ABK0LNK6_RAT